MRPVDTKFADMARERLELRTPRRRLRGSSKPRLVHLYGPRRWGGYRGRFWRLHIRHGGRRLLEALLEASVL